MKHDPRKREQSVINADIKDRERPPASGERYLSSTPATQVDLKKRVSSCSAAATYCFHGLVSPQHSLLQSGPQKRKKRVRFGREHVRSYLTSANSRSELGIRHAGQPISLTQKMKLSPVFVALLILVLILILILILILVDGIRNFPMRRCTCIAWQCPK